MSGPRVPAVGAARSSVHATVGGPRPAASVRQYGSDRSQENHVGARDVPPDGGSGRRRRRGLCRGCPICLRGGAARQLIGVGNAHGGAGIDRGCHADPGGQTKQVRRRGQHRGGVQGGRRAGWCAVARRRQRRRTGMASLRARWKPGTARRPRRIRTTSGHRTNAATAAAATTPRSSDRPAICCVGMAQPDPHLAVGSFLIPRFLAENPIRANFPDYYSR